MADKILLQVPENIQKLINHWESKEKLQKMKSPKQDENGLFIKPSKTFISAVNLLRSLLAGSFLIDKDKHELAKTYEVNIKEEFTEQEIMMSIDRFFICATDMLYFPEKKDFIRKLSLSQFIWNYNANNKKFRSWFLYCYTTAPELLSDRALKYREARVMR